MSTKFVFDGIEIPANLPLLPVRDVVVFPYMILPLFVGRDHSIKAVMEAMKRDRLIFLATQKNVEDEEPEAGQIYQVGTVAMIMRMRKLQDGRLKVLAQGLTKGQIEQFVQTKPFYEVQYKPLIENSPVPLAESYPLVGQLKEQIERLIALGKSISPDILLVAEDIKDPGKLADLITSHLGLSVPQAQKVLEITHPLERIKEIQKIIQIEIEDFQARNKNDPKEEQQRYQRESNLKEHIRNIKTEMGEGDNRNQEFADLHQKISDAKMSPEAELESKKQLKRLEKMHPDASEASLIRNYIDWLLDLPWQVKSEDTLRLDYLKEEFQEFILKEL